MSDVTKWDPVAANNNDPPPDGAPEGMPASTVNDVIRENMAAVRRLADDGGWFDHGHAYTYVSATVFQVAGDQSAVYTVGRRVRAIGTLTGTIYGSITGVAVTANTDVTCAWDSGQLENEALQSIAVGQDQRASPSAASGLLGEVKLLSHTSLGSDYLEASGQAVSRTTYAALDALYSADGYPFGDGNGTSTFNLPDLNGRSALGRGAGTGTTRTLGDSIGAETHQLTTAEMPSHTHGFTASVSSHTVGDPGSTNSGNTPGGGTTGSAGSNAAHNNMQPSLAMVYAVKVL